MEGIADLEIYHFEPYPFVLEPIAVRAMSECDNSKIEFGELVFDCENKLLCLLDAKKCIPIKFIPRLVHDDRYYYLDLDGVIKVVETRQRGYKVLRRLGENVAATVEINGIHMHRISGIDPWRDTLAKIRAVRIRRGNVVLDTCMGLGYTAIASIREGARHVITVEIDEEIIWIAERNPWSRMLADKRITIIHGDVVEIVHVFKDESFDRIIHDPPRFSSSTGDLYGTPLYRQFFRILKPGGILYHYLGEPGRYRGINLYQSVKRRLLNVGFENVRWVEAAKGIVARKPIF